MPHVSFSRQVGRLCMLVLGVHGFMTGSIALFSRVSTDTFFEQHWHYSSPVLMQRRNYFRFWQPDFLAPTLTRDERECLESWLAILSLEAPPLVSRTLSTRVILQDSLAMLDGIGELRDVVYALSCCLVNVSPDVREIRRERQGQVTFLHCKMVLDMALRIPFTKRSFSVFSMPTATTLQLDAPSYSPHKLHISAAEHRWWGGRIWSTQTGSMRSPWGDLGDLVRRYNGFMMSTMVTKEVTVQERMAVVRLRAQVIEDMMKTKQEEQVALVQQDHGMNQQESSDQ